MRRKKTDAVSPLTLPVCNPLSLDLQFAGSISIAPLRPARLRQLVKASLEQASTRQPDRGLSELTLRFVARAEARHLNITYRESDYAPNVLTFDYPDLQAADIIICPPVVREQASTQRKRYADHLSHMVVHGVLHALGHTHERPGPARLMEQLERAILARFQIDDPYATN